jgi:hypothetical protein
VYGCRCRIPDAGYRMPDVGCRIQDAKYKIGIMERTRIMELNGHSPQ